MGNFSWNTIDIIIFTLFIVRFIGTIVYFEIWFKLKEKRYAYLSAGWLIYTLSPLCFLFRDSHLLFIELYSIFATLGIIWIIMTTFTYFSPINVYQIIKITSFLYVFIYIIINLLNQVEILNIITPLLQFIFIIISLIATIINLNKIKKEASRSYHWLIITEIFGVMHSLGYVFFYNGELKALSYSLTVGLSTMMIVFFINLENNLRLNEIREKEKQLEISLKEIKRKNEEAETILNAAVGREMKMIELKKKLKGKE